MRIARHREAALAPEQLIDRHVGPLALDVPQGLVQAAQRVVQHGPIAPVGAGVGVLPQVLDAIDVPALGEGSEVLVHGGGDGQRPLRKRGAPEAVQSRLAGLDLHHAQPDPLRRRENRFDILDLQRRQALGRLAVRLSGRTGLGPAEFQGARMLLRIPRSGSNHADSCCSPSSRVSLACNRRRETLLSMPWRAHYHRPACGATRWPGSIPRYSARGRRWQGPRRPARCSEY